MHVDVENAGDHIMPAGVDPADAVARRRAEILSQRNDFLAADADIARASRRRYTEPPVIIVSRFMGATSSKGVYSPQSHREHREKHRETSLINARILCVSSVSSVTLWLAPLYFLFPVLSLRSQRRPLGGHVLVRVLLAVATLDVRNAAENLLDVD